MVGGAALTGVYRYAASLNEQRLEDYRSFVVGEFAGLGRAAAVTLDRTAGVATDPEGRPDAVAIARDFASSSESFARVLVVDASGTVVVSHPRRTSEGLSPELSRLAGSAGVRGRFAESVDASGNPALWVYRTAARDDRHAVFARLKLDSVASLLDRIGATQGRMAALVGEDGRVRMASAGMPHGIIDKTDYLPGRDDPGEGVVRVGEIGTTRLAGAWGRVTGLPGVEWTVVVAEPVSLAARETWAALVPAALMMLLVGAGMVVLTYVAAGYLVRPLQELEVRAHKVRDGAYVRPLHVRGEDEVGRMTRAFNSLVLRLNALHDVTELMAAASHLDQVLDAAVASLRHIAPAARIALLLASDPPGSLRLVRVTDPSIQEGSEVPLTEASRMGEVLGALGPASPLLDIEDPDPAAGPLAPWLDARSGSVLYFPLLFGAEHLGVLVVRTPSRDLTDGEIEMVRTFSSQLAVAVRTSRLFEVEHASRREAEMLRAVAERLSDPSGIIDALGVVGGLAGAVLAAPGTGFGLDGQVSAGSERASIPPEMEERMALWRALEEGAGDVSFEPHWVDRATGADEIRAWLSGRGFESALVVPLVAEESVRGVMVAPYLAGGPNPDERRIALAAAIAKQVSLALENTSLFERARKRAANLETVFTIGQTVSSTLQSRVVLNRVLDVVQKILSADAVSLMTYDPARKTIATAMARGLISRDMLYLETARGQDIPGAVFDSRTPVRIGRLEPGDEGLEGLAGAQGLRSLLSVPLVSRDRSIGVLTVLSRSADAFDQEDTELLMTFASQAALAIDNASLFSREHAVASMLQSSLLPGELSRFDGLEAASEYRPASPDADIGGDYYDMFTAPDGRVAVVIGDVCGKGVVAATKTSMIKYSVRGLIAAGMAPAEALGTLNDMVKETGDTSDIVTLWLGLIDVDEGGLEYANGGHPPALLYDQGSGRFHRLEPTGPLLGAIQGAAYEAGSLVMPPGATLLLYTDGVTEARKGNRFFGEGRIRRVMKSHKDAVGSVRGLLEALERFAPGVLRDDVAVVAVTRRV